MALRDRAGYGGVLGGAGVPSAPYGQPGGLAVGRLAVGLGEGGRSATATFRARSGPSPPPTDNQAGLPWALRGVSDTTEL